MSELCPAAAAASSCSDSVAPQPRRPRTQSAVVDVRRCPVKYSPWRSDSCPLPSGAVDPNQTRGESAVVVAPSRAARNTAGATSVAGTCPTRSTSREWSRDEAPCSLALTSLLAARLHHHSSSTLCSPDLSSLRPLSPIRLTTSFVPIRPQRTLTMTRTHKATDRDHAGLANGTAAAEEHLPRYFGKAGFADANPAATKKQGSGKANWGREGESELEDYSYNMSKARRRTNSSSLASGHNGALRTKFETLDPDVIEYDEHLHGPSHTDMADLEKMSSSSTIGSTEEEDAAVKN